MKKKILCLLLAGVMALLSLSLFSCKKPVPEQGTITRMTVDINPGVEFMIDDKGLVVSATALNDDGELLIVGESFVGKTPEQAVELMVTLAVDTGYLVKGNATEGTNTVKVSISGEGDYTEALMSDVRKQIDKALDACDVEGAVQRVEALKLDALRALAATASSYTDAEIAEMDEEQLCAVIAAGRVETALLIGEEMREAYFAAKEHEISFAKSEQTAKIIEQMGGLYALSHTAYKAALELYGEAIAELDEFRYEMLVSPESEYQCSLAALREAKAEMLKQRSYTASLEVNGEEYASASATLAMSEEQYNALLASFEALGTELNAAMESLIAALNQSFGALTELEKTLFDGNVEQKLQEKAGEIEAALNTAKDGFFAAFEQAHGDDITAAKDALLERKQALKAKIDGAE